MEKLREYYISRAVRSGLEFEIQYMPKLFADNGRGPKEPHLHNYYQIIWFQRGKGTHQVDYVDYPVTDNTLFFIAPGQEHHFDESSDYVGVVIHFNASFMADEESTESIFMKYNVFNAYDSLPYCRISSEEAERLMALVREMSNEYSLTGAFAHKDYMLYLLRLFLIRVQRGGERHDTPKLYVTSIANRTFVRFRQLVEQNFKTVHTVSEYADMLNISSRTLTKYVAESTRRTPLQIINDRIALEAQRLIQSTSLSIKEVAEQLGFDDPSYFVKFLKRQTGKMPTELRSRLPHS